MSKHFLNIPVIYRLVTRWIGYLPTPLSYAISQNIADLSYMLYNSAVKNVKQNLRLVFPKLPDKKLSRLARGLFRNYSKYIVDCGRFANFNKKALIEQIVCYEGKENLDNVLQLNKGLILLTAHLGNWELGGMFFGSYGFKINVLTLPDENPEIDTIRSWHRSVYGVKTITVGNTPFSMLEMAKALDNKEIIAMLIDRYHTGLDSLTTDFFHKPTLFPRGPFVLSRLMGTPIIVAFVVKEKNVYKGIIERPLIVANENEEYETLKKVVNTFEKYILLYPDQWYNFIPI